MSIFYNPRMADAARLRLMKRIQILRVVVLIGACAIAIRYAHAQTPTPSAPALEPIAFLTAHEWDAKLPDSPDGKKKKIHARFTWTQNRQAIRISNELVTDGKASPYIDLVLTRVGSAAACDRVLVCKRRRKPHQSGRWGCTKRGNWSMNFTDRADGKALPSSRSASNAAWE